MRTSVGRSRIYRRAAAEIPSTTFGAHCPHLATDSQHGAWSFAVDVPTADRRRTHGPPPWIRHAPLWVQCPGGVRGPVTAGST
ncbi:hypothetical protein [Streptomyces sp. NPDC088762]|uniref:hypothetical protein n=1 Tax=Streptomyces sp. NPDC088762 TaxID=3365891 RepID=UPI00381C35E8